MPTNQMLLVLLVLAYVDVVVIAHGARKPAGLCVFDMDKTLTRGADAKASECCSAGESCLASEPYVTYCAGEHPSPQDVPRLYDCRPSCHCGEPGCELSGHCPFFNSTRMTNSTMGGNQGTSCEQDLTRSGRTRQLPGAFAQGAIKRCLDAGMAVAVATAELYDPAAANRVFLQGLSRDAFGDEFFDALECSGSKPCAGHLLQWGEPFNQYGKPLEMRNLVDWLDSRGLPPRCMLFFDDNQNNGWSAVQAGAHSMSASTNCAGGGAFLCCDACGLTEANFDEGWHRLTGGHVYVKPGGNETSQIAACSSMLRSHRQ